jgi:hypothetical protein
MNNINQQTSRVVTLLNQEIVLSSLSPMQRAAPQLDYDINKLRTLIAEYVGIELKRVTDEAPHRGGPDVCARRSDGPPLSRRLLVPFTASFARIRK